MTAKQNDYQNRHRAKLREAGGRQLLVTLQPDTNAILASLRKRCYGGNNTIIALALRALNEQAAATPAELAMSRPARMPPDPRYIVGAGFNYNDDSGEVEHYEPSGEVEPE